MAISRVIGVGAAMMLAGAALGQGTSTNQVRLELRLVSQIGLPGTSPVTSADVSTHTDTTSGLGVARRFEVQYRLVDLDENDAFVPAGLTSGNLRIIAIGGTIERAILSKNEARNPSGGLPPVGQSVNLDTDSSAISGNATIGPFRGLHAPYRGGVPAPAPNNDNAANGVFSVGNTVLSGITPLSLSQTNQNDGGWYGLFSFNFIPTSGSGSVDVSLDPDMMTGNRFGFFTDGDPVPVTSPVATTDAASIVAGGPLGACCPPNGVCTLTSNFLCGGLAGTYLGNDTTCTPSPCPALGACCDTTVGTCSLLTVANCTGPNVLYLSDGSICSPNPCPPSAACCLPNLTCVLLTSAGCTAAGGTSIGVGTTCASNPCPPPYACCLPGFVCLIASSSADCITAGGTPLLRNTCVPQVCCPSPVISSQPQAWLLIPPQTVTLTVAASHPGTIAYQWRRNGVNLVADGRISGVTTPTLTISNTTSADAGPYDVVLTASCGTSITSAAAVVTNCVPPAIANQPTGFTVCEGGGNVLAVSASGSGGLSYQWRKDGNDIMGAVDAVLEIAAATSADAGTYDCVVTNPCGTIVTQAAVVVVNSPPTFAVQPMSATACLGSTATFTAAANGGTASLTYQWRKNGENIMGADAASYSIPAVTGADAATYDCQVTTVCGSAISQAATLVVHEPPSITADPVGAARCPGESVELTVAASGLEPRSYQWRRNGENVEGATSPTLSLASLTLSQAGNYDCVVTNACGSATSTAATLVVNTPVAITTPPTPLTRCVTTSASFIVVATGSPPPTYQWRKGGMNIAGANAAILTIPAVSEADAGSYDCIVANVCGSVTTTAAALTVTTPPSITMQPASQSPCEGASATFQVTAAGTPPLTYFWRRDGMPLANSNTPTYVISAVGSGDVGTYDCVVTNSCGSSTSSGAPLTIGTAPSIGMQPVSQTAGVGTNAALTVQVTGAAPLLYQWRRNGVVMAVSPTIPDVTSHTLSFLPVTVADDGFYDCVIANACGAVVSSPAVLTVSCAGAPAALDCNGNGLCDTLELAGLRDIIAPSAATDDRFGWHVSVDGNRLLVGARSTDTVLGSDAGAAYLYRFDAGVWSLEHAFTAADGESGAEFGNHVALQGEWAFVAARFATVSGQGAAGAVYVYRNSGSAWSLFQKIVEPTPVFAAWFGHGVDLDQDRAIIGSIRGNGVQARTGVSYVYRFNGLNWSRESTLTAPDGAFGDGFGISVAIDDPYAVVGAPYNVESGVSSGAGYVFFRSPSGWVLQSKVRPSVPQNSQTFGEIVAIAGDIVAVNAPRENVDAVTWAGAVHTFRRTDTRWTHQRRLVAPAPQANELFGYYLALKGDVMAVGGFLRDVAGFAGAGSVDVFRRRGNYWTRADRIESPKPETNSRFGYSLSISGNRLAVGAHGGTAGLVPNAGWVRVFDLGALDCDNDGVPDVCELAFGTAVDADGNGIPDDCQIDQCQPDFNDSGLLSVQDIFDFLADYFAGNLTADFNDSGILSVQDIFDFLASYFAGCP